MRVLLLYAIIAVVAAVVFPRFVRDASLTDVLLFLILLELSFFRRDVTETSEIVRDEVRGIAGDVDRLTSRLAPDSRDYD